VLITGLPAAETLGRPNRSQLLGVGRLVQEIGEAGGREREGRRHFHASVVAPLGVRPDAGPQRVRRALRSDARGPAWRVGCVAVVGAPTHWRFG
jgi:hypothetical protein